MREWDGTPQASQFAATPRGLDALFTRMERIERLLNQLTGANILSAADVFASKGGLTIASELLVTGATRIEGTLSLPRGIIDNDALTSPVVPVAFNFPTGGFGTGDGWVTVAQTTLPAPAGFTRAIVVANAGVTVTNTTSASRSIVARTVIGGSYGFMTYGPQLVPGGLGSVASNHTALLSAGGVTISCQVWTSQAWAADGGNAAGVNGVVLWLR